MKHRYNTLIALSISSSFVFCQQPISAQVAVGLAAGNLAAQKKQQAASAQQTAAASDAMKRFLDSQKKEIEKAMLGSPLRKKAGSPGSMYSKDGRINPALAAKESNQLFAQAKQKESAGNDAEACKLYRQALMVRYTVWGAKDPSIFTIAKKLGELSMQQGKYADSVDAYKLCMQVGINLYGVGSYELCPTLEGLGDAYMAQNQYRDAVSNYRQVYALQDRKLGAEDATTIRTMRKYTVSLVSDKQYPLAESLIKEHVLPTKDSLANPADMRLCMVAYASLLRNTDRATEADSIESSLGTNETSREASANAGNPAENAGSSGENPGSAQKNDGATESPGRGGN